MVYPSLRTSAYISVTTVVHPLACGRPSELKTWPSIWRLTSIWRLRFQWGEITTLTCQARISTGTWRTSHWGAWLPKKCSTGSLRWTKSSERGLLSTRVVKTWPSSACQSRGSGTRLCGTSTLSTWCSQRFTSQWRRWPWSHWDRLKRSMSGLIASRKLLARIMLSRTRTHEENVNIHYFLVKNNICI